MRPTLSCVSRSTLWLAALVAVASVAAPLNAWGAQQASNAGQTSSQAGQTSAAQPDSLADAARKAREQKKDAKPAKVFTNDNIPSTGGISTVGSTGTAAAASQSGDSASGAAGATDKASGADEKAWRTRFQKLHAKLDEDKTALDVLQREAEVDRVQFYGGDPQKAVQDQTSQQPNGAAFNKRLAEIDTKKKAVEADQQAIDDAEDELRKAGGDPGWSR